MVKVEYEFRIWVVSFKTMCWRMGFKAQWEKDSMDLTEKLTLSLNCPTVLHPALLCLGVSLKEARKLWGSSITYSSTHLWYFGIHIIIIYELDMRLSLNLLSQAMQYNWGKTDGQRTVLYPLIKPKYSYVAIFLTDIKIHFLCASIH